MTNLTTNNIRLCSFSGIQMLLFKVSSPKFKQWISKQGKKRRVK